MFFLVFFFFFSFFFLFFLALKLPSGSKFSQFALKSPSRLLDRVIDLTRIVLLSLYNNCYELSTRLDEIPIAITRIKEPSLLLSHIKFKRTMRPLQFPYPLITTTLHQKIHTFRESDERTLALLSPEARGFILDSPPRIEGMLDSAIDKII